MPKKLLQKGGEWGLVGQFAGIIPIIPEEKQLQVFLSRPYPVEQGVVFGNEAFSDIPSLSGFLKHFRVLLDLFQQCIDLLNEVLDFLFSPVLFQMFEDLKVCVSGPGCPVDIH